MEDRLSYQIFCEWINSFQFRNDPECNKFENIVEKVEQYIPIDVLEYFYPQFLFVEDKDTEFLFVTKHKLFLVTGTDKKV